VSMIPAALRRFVIRRAANVCEYCGLSQQGQEAMFHIDHVIPRMAGGATDTENLALARVSCSLRKAAIAPHSGNEVPLYNPRCDDWQAHFQWQGVTLLGMTPTGRATIAALRMNRPMILAIRQEEAAPGRHPPQMT
jgi:hypothetical protein